MPLCHPHLCHDCGATVDGYAIYGLSCVKSQGRHPRHNALKDIVHLSLTAAGVPSQKEPYGLARYDGKCPDSVTMMPRSCGPPLYGMSLVPTPLRKLTVAWQSVTQGR